MSKRAKKNMFTLKEQIEDIVRKSAVRSEAGNKSQNIKIDDKLVSIFARDKRGRKSK